MENKIFEIISNKKIANGVYEMRLFGDTSAITRAGQFVNIKLDGFYLRRPISVCDWDEKSLTLIYKTAGEGTKAMATMDSGKLDLLVGLGNGYDLEKAGERPVLIGGGVGVPPLYGAAKRLENAVAILGFNTAGDAFYVDKFREVCKSVYITTVDGSLGTRGFVTGVLKDLDYSYFYTCGPAPMLKAVYDASKRPGEFSFEERMGCGFGACMGCSVKTKNGNKRICKDGPVLSKEEIIW